MLSSPHRVYSKEQSEPELYLAAWAKSSGNEVLETAQDDGLIRIYVKRLH